MSKETKEMGIDIDKEIVEAERKTDKENKDGELKRVIQDMYRNLSKQLAEINKKNEKRHIETIKRIEILQTPKPELEKARLVIEPPLECNQIITMQPTHVVTSVIETKIEELKDLFNPESELVESKMIIEQPLGDDQITTQNVKQNNFESDKVIIENIKKTIKTKKRKPKRRKRRVKFKMKRLIKVLHKYVKKLINKIKFTNIKNHYKLKHNYKINHLFKNKKTPIMTNKRIDPFKYTRSSPNKTKLKGIKSKRDCVQKGARKGQLGAYQTKLIQANHQPSHKQLSV